MYSTCTHARAIPLTTSSTGGWQKRNELKQKHLRQLINFSFEWETKALPLKFNAYHIRTNISANNETETNRKKRKKNSKYVFSSGLWCDVRQLTTSLLTFGSGKPISPICHRFSIEWARARISHFAHSQSFVKCVEENPFHKILSFETRMERRAMRRILYIATNLHKYILMVNTNKRRPCDAFTRLRIC